MTNWVVRNEKSIIRAAFLIPILSVAAISISHVVSWYDLANPMSWAIYLSIAVEIAAMSSIAAASVKIKGFSVWIVFIIVTLIQFIGNIFFCYSEIDITSKPFRDWSELTAPVFEAMGSDLSDTVAQRRWLAMLEGGLLPLISLTCLHFFIQYGEIDKTKEVKPEASQPSDSSQIESDELRDEIFEVKESQIDPILEPETASEDPQEEPQEEDVILDDYQEESKEEEVILADYQEEPQEEEIALEDPQEEPVSQVEDVLPEPKQLDLSEKVEPITPKVEPIPNEPKAGKAIPHPADLMINVVPRKKPELSQALKKIKGR